MVYLRQANLHDMHPHDSCSIHLPPPAGLLDGPASEQDEQAQQSTDQGLSVLAALVLPLLFSFAAPVVEKVHCQSVHGSGPLPLADRMVVIENTQITRSHPGDARDRNRASSYRHKQGKCVLNRLSLAKTRFERSGDADRRPRAQ
jgi:hypothetical protein